MAWVENRKFEGKREELRLATTRSVWTRKRTQHDQ